ncbi:MAG: isoaspartyl peptidase/L-asparaginase [Dokdonella sp.]|uniref:isoaspartyl peptidase/L-asparaginase family protein n=1 Tax=Dokdonella sp. TaxID=2291710 RepID=UPI0025B9ED2B|nr:isoaspartyl peptidase/L-asparaginase [Dokdonella sp.]MBX3701616.1 isoaspartyl peptidase/L-asparaginase [Dokdonella sp.]
MHLRRLALLTAAMLSTTAAIAATPVLVIHGGAGVIRSELSPEAQQAVRADLEAALAAGYAVLKEGGTSLDAVGKAIVILEDSPRFNAGKGAVFTHDGRNELDAAIMDGATLRAGAIAGVHRIKNPILLARAVMEKSPHVFMVGDGAEAFAQSVGIELVDPSYFRTEQRWQQLQEVLRKEAAGQQSSLGRMVHYGTVGAVALDAAGHLAAATSTGGMTNKRYGRVGDSPIIGAGTYANAQCAVSGTGWGEYYIRTVAAHDICARVAYAKQPLAKAADEVVMKLIPQLGGDGGAIALDAKGNIAMPFNTDGMYRGWVDKSGKVHVAIFKD